MTVLVVDDDFRNIFALTALLERVELEVISAESGEEGVALLEQTPDIDLVLVDIMMPGMDGYATMRAMRSAARGQRPPAHRRSRRRSTPASASAASTRAPPLRPQARRHVAELLLDARRMAPGRRARRTAGGARLRLMASTVHARRRLKRSPAPAILVVDDNAAKRVALRAMLAPLGYRVVEADSGRAALRAVADADFAMILMDVRMPTLDGYETAKLIRAAGPWRAARRSSSSPPSAATTERQPSAYASGAVDFIFTPILPDVLRAKVTAFVDLFLQSQELQRSLESITRSTRRCATAMSARRRCSTTSPTGSSSSTRAA